MHLLLWNPFGPGMDLGTLFSYFMFSYLSVFNVKSSVSFPLSKTRLEAGNHSRKGTKTD